MGVERRAAFYETAGALRDMIQSHVLQLASLGGHGSAGDLRRDIRAK